MLLTGHVVPDLLILLVILLSSIFLYFKWSYQYWARKKILFVEPSIPFGNLENPGKKTVHLGFYFKQFYDHFRGLGAKHAGLYRMASPTYFPIDLDYIKNILTKDFNYFMDRGLYSNEQDDPISAHLFALQGQKWKNLRAKLTPTFTSGKLKAMFQTVTNVGLKLEKFMEEKTKSHEAIEIKDLLDRFTTDVIGSCAFGLDCNSFTEPNSLFSEKGRSLFASSPKRAVRILFQVAFPNLARKLRMRALPEDISEFYRKVVTETVEYRRKNTIVRQDFLQLLIELKNNEQLTLNELSAQSFLFFIAGFETSSAAMTFTLFELARNPEVQSKVRQEIKEVLKKHDGQITYDSINDLKYLNQVFDEILRMYPPAPFIIRQCSQDYRLKNEGTTIERGTKVVIPVLGIHYDERYYPEPEKFDPERFNEVNKAKRHAFAHLPFGEGPRICIGMRFAQMQSKVGLVSLLRNFKFSVNSKTKLPLKMEKNSLSLSAQGGIWLNCTKI